MSQEIREYELIQLDSDNDEARRLAVTATVGPTPEEQEQSRGVQLTLETPNGYSYGRVSEEQIRDLIAVLQKRIEPNEAPEATGIEWRNKRVQPNGDAERKP